MAVTMTQPLENGMATKKLVNAKDVFVLKNGVEVGLDTIFGEINTSLGNKVNTIILPEVGAKYVMTSTGWVASDVLKLIELQDWTDDNKVLFIGDTDDKNAIAVVRARDEIRLVPESGKVVIEPNHGTAQLEMCKADGSTVEVLGAITQIQTDLSGKGTYSKPSNGIPSTDLESGVQTSLGKANSAVQKPSSTTDGKQYVMKNGEWHELENGGGGGGTTDYEQLENKPQIAGVELTGNKSLADLGAASSSDLAGKANASHTHAQSDITGLASALAGKAASSHTHAQSDITGLETALAGKASSADLTDLAAKVGNESSGLVKAVADLQTDVSGVETELFNING